MNALDRYVTGDPFGVWDWPVRAEGLEPPCRKAAGPKPAVSTSSTTPAPAPEPVEPPSGDDKGPESVPKTVPTVPTECPPDDIDWWYYLGKTMAYESARRI
jgi:hypothetical protein